MSELKLSKEQQLRWDIVDRLIPSSMGSLKTTSKDELLKNAKAIEQYILNG